eukprot:4511104-Amphidinium_carterae.1
MVVWCGIIDIDRTNVVEGSIGDPQHQMLIDWSHQGIDECSDFDMVCDLKPSVVLFCEVLA